MACMRLQNFIDGRFEETTSHLDSYNPATGRVWAEVPDSGVVEVDRAVRAAEAAFEQWSATPLGERSRLLNKAADLLESRLQEFADLESSDQGKPVWLAKSVDIPRAVHNLRFFASCVLHDLNFCNVMDAANAVNYTVKMPVGVVGVISPWNLPLYLLTFKIAPAIAVGNTVVAKPSELTSVTAWKFCEILNEAGFPPGVVNIVFGYGAKAGEAIVSHPKVKLISFTGGTATASRLKTTSASLHKRLSLELGGKNAAVIFSDADLDKCIETTIRSSFLNQGEICLCTSRVFVQEDIYEKFLESFTEATRNLVVGNPKLKDIFIGALISKEHREKVKRYIQIAREEGATVRCGEGVDEMNLSEEIKNGYFLRPTIITDVKDESRLMQEEIFGPVTCVVPFNTEEEVIQRANNVQYGLAATLWTHDAGKLHRVAQKLQAGTVWANCWLIRDLNMPFGGMKASGVGREGGRESIEFFTEKKTICIKL